MKKRLLGILLSFALMLTMMPTLSLPAFATSDPQPSVLPENSGRVATRHVEEYQGWVLTATPEEGYEFDKWTYTGTGGTQQSVDNPFFIPDATVEGYGDLTAHFKAELYPLWVGGTQVTSANMSGPGWEYTPATTGENPTPAKLKLNGYSYSGEGYNNAAIYAEENLIIETTGDNNVENTSKKDNTCAIWVTENLTLQGSGTLNATGGEHEGILASNVTINGGTVYATSNGVGVATGALGTVTINGGAVSATAGIGISASQGVMINGGTVTAAGEGTNSAGIYSSNNGVTITDGTVIATGTGYKSAGIEAYNNIVTISGGKVTATGNYVAIKGNVKNAIAGTGWTDTEGTEGKADISVSSEGQTLSYKNVQFPAKAEPTPTPTPTPAPAPANASITVNSKTVSAGTLAAACAKAGVNPDSVATVVLGKKVKKIKKGSFQNLRNVDTLVVKSKKLTKARVKGSLKGSSITKVKVKVGKKKTNKYYAKRYKKIFTKKNCGKKVSVSR